MFQTEKARKQQKAWREAHKDYLREYNKKYAASHKEELAKYYAHYYAEKKEKIKLVHQERYRKNREKILQRGREKKNSLPLEERRSRQLRIYGIDWKQYTELYNKQNGVCAACGNPETSIRKPGIGAILCVDHDHNTNKIRGLLCSKCNRALGLMSDNISLLLSAADYIIQSRGPNGKP